MIIDKRPKGQVFLPSSKSISHRALIAAALSGGGLIEHLADNQDTEATLHCLGKLGASFLREEDTVTFTAGARKPAGKSVLDCGESGSTLRFLIPVAAALGVTADFTGRGRLMERPLGPYESSLAGNGVQIQRDGDMLHVEGQLKAGRFEIPGDISSQFVTGLLFALPLLEDDSEIVISGALESKAYVDLTLDVLEKFRIKVANKHYERFIIPGGQKYISHDLFVEADYSAAAFFLASAALGCNVECMGLSMESRQGDRAILQILKRCGCEIETGPNGGICVTGEDLSGIIVDVTDIPDLVPPLAALMCFLPGESSLTNAGRLRLKESDRLSAVAEELSKLGGFVAEGEDYLSIQGVETIRGGAASAHNDHRIAMMAAVLSLKAEEPVSIDDPDCVKKSYPKFWRDFCHESFR